MDWSVPEHVSIVCSLFAEQVEKGNWPNTHLNAVGYAEIQLKNKWEKLKGDLTTWRKLMRSQTGTGWDHLIQTIEMDPEWWSKIKAEIPGCAKFMKGPLQNEADLIKMFDKITNDENDFVDAECEIPNDFTSPGSDVVKEVSPSVCNGKKRPRVTIKQVMELVVACGAAIGSNEHFLASKLFIKTEQREMFMTLDTHDSRFLWLNRHYNEQYVA
ncbi:hypothetical protein BS78_K072900 [Paspalum vaginatum]|uniref:Myb/SANT-like domain-containing protein n=1 Tax=Paspalum vaginatum TaxID=158149 RepID=A0A9W8CE45_9POAL|nr:hypothetical protein BS78_K072900 [Paspalum vaginatum]